MAQVTCTLGEQLRVTAEMDGAANPVVTDGPTMINGKGEMISPTDLVSVAVGNCMLTMLGAAASKKKVDVTGARAEVSKELASSPPFKITKMPVKIHMPAGLPQDVRPALEQGAQSCPVHHSLHPDVDSPVEFIYPD